jgi:hypothetical protein
LKLSHVISQNIMKSTIFLTIGACLVFYVTNALVLEKRDNPAVVAFNFKRAVGTPASQLRRHKRQVSATLGNQDVTWYVELMLGTPPQTTNVQLDTGSSDLVVETTSPNLCGSQPTVCSGLGACKHSTSCV